MVEFMSKKKQISRSTRRRKRTQGPSSPVEQHFFEGLIARRELAPEGGRLHSEATHEAIAEEGKPPVIKRKRFLAA